MNTNYEATTSTKIPSICSLSAVLRKSVGALLTSAALGVTGSAQAATVDQAFNKINETFNYIKAHTNKHAWNSYIAARDTKAIVIDVQSRISDIQSDIGVLRPTGGAFDNGTVPMLVDHVEQSLPMVAERLVEISSFNANSIRTDLHGIIQNLNKLDPTARLYMRSIDTVLSRFIDGAPDALFYPLAETDIVTRLARKLADYDSDVLLAIASKLQNEKDLEQPQLLSCDNVLPFFEQDPKLEHDLSRLLLQTENIALLLKAVSASQPDVQVVGITAVGGGTISIPSPTASAFAYIGLAVEGTTMIAKRWLDRVSSCSQAKLQGRLEEFLNQQGY